LVAPVIACCDPGLKPYLFFLFFDFVQRGSEEERGEGGGEEGGEEEGGEEEEGEMA